MGREILLNPMASAWVESIREPRMTPRRSEDQRRSPIPAPLRLITAVTSSNTCGEGGVRASHTRSSSLLSPGEGVRTNLRTWRFPRLLRSAVPNNPDAPANKITILTERKRDSTRGQKMGIEKVSIPIFRYQL